MPVEEMSSKLEQILGGDAAALLHHQCKIPKENLHLPGPDYVERIYGGSDRPTRVLGSLQSLINHGRLAGTGYVSILPVDQGIEHSGGASFAPNPMYFDPENLVKLAIEIFSAVLHTFRWTAAYTKRSNYRGKDILCSSAGRFSTSPTRSDSMG